jgi:hypothetical protein
LGGIGQRVEIFLLKAAGTPTITPLPVNSLARLIFVPGEFSVSTSMSGRESPTLTILKAEVWKAETGDWNWDWAADFGRFKTLDRIDTLGLAVVKSRVWRPVLIVLCRFWRWID